MTAPSKRQEGFWETVRTVVYAILVALVIRTLLFEPFNIPSGSMIPTLLVGDYLFVSKFSYGYSKHSFPFSIVPVEGRILGSGPKRGDVVVFKLPRDNKTDYIKRIVGLPGDRLQMINGILNINGQPVQRERIEDRIEFENGQMIRTMQYVETLPNGRRHLILENDDRGPLDNTPEYVVPQGYYFGMGDNRDNSLDSRVQNAVGYIPAENLVGRAEILFFSTDGTAAVWEVWRWPLATRFSRFFTGIN